MAQCSTTPKKLDASWVAMDSPSDDSDGQYEIQNQKAEAFKAVNKLLGLKGLSPLKSTLKVSWVDATPKTKKYYVSKMEEVVRVVLDVIAPEDAGLLWNALKESPDINHYYDESPKDSSLLYSLVESYKHATHSSTRKSILSVIADKLSFRDLEKLIPGISRHHYTTARRHACQFGMDALTTSMETNSRIVRQRADPNQVEHFIEFITSQNFVQDMPFGRRKLSLTSGEEIEIPNVIRVLIPSRLINQYLSYCQETKFTPLGKRTLFRIVSESCGPRLESV